MKRQRRKSEEQVREEKRKSEESQKKEDVGVQKGGKVAKHRVFRLFCGSGGSKSRLAKTAGAELVHQIRDEKLHTIVARSTFPSQNAQNTSGLDHLWKLRYRKSAPPKLYQSREVPHLPCKGSKRGPSASPDSYQCRKCTPAWRSEGPCHHVPCLPRKVSGV